MIFFRELKFQKIVLDKILQKNRMNSIAHINSK